ncbi:MAG: reverse transcriptase/maturase family protein [Methylococcales bacterium]|nr:reverse transcriptase/maturase family protein [Methylococcales bacterium]
MKRQFVAITDIADYDNLLTATWKAAKGKYHRPDVQHFIADLDNHLQQLSNAILQGHAPIGHYLQFYIHDPKLRLITAVCFEDRVLHHAVMNVAEAVIERALIPTTYACRQNKGVHKAVQQVQNNLRRFSWFVKVDIRHYFSTIDHNRLFQLLSRRFKGEDFLNLLWRIIDSYHTKPNKGLPIGSLTSQHFANYYLDGADRFLTQHPQVCAVVRYMDDIIWWCNDKATAIQVLKQITDYLEAQRRLQLKSSVQINRSVNGVTYCGYRILPATFKLTIRKKRRYKQLRQRWEYLWQRSKINSLKLQQAYDAVHAVTLHTDSLAWRKRNLQLHPSCYTTSVG